MNEEIKTRSFRITEETAEKFKSLCMEFPNQNAALESLINAYEIQSATAVLVDRQADISDYSSHIQALQSAFIHSLELNESAESRIRSAIGTAVEDPAPPFSARTEMTRSGLSPPV